MIIYEIVYEELGQYIGHGLYEESINVIDRFQSKQEAEKHWKK